MSHMGLGRVENLNAHGADGIFQRDCTLRESNHAAHLAVRWRKENFIFGVSLKNAFSHSQGHQRRSRRLPGRRPTSAMLRKRTLACPACRRSRFRSKGFLCLHCPVSERKRSLYTSGRSGDWLKSKNPASVAVGREGGGGVGTVGPLSACDPRLEQDEHYDNDWNDNPEEHRGHSE